jgi:hypothetical protein
MPQSPADIILAKAKAVGAQANKAFPTTLSKVATAPTPVAAAKPTVAPKPAANLGTELAAKKNMIDKAAVTTPTLTPKMHRGGSVQADGDYNLKKGEHVLTPAEAKKLRKHAALLAGLKSLAIESKPNLSGTKKGVI